MRVRIAKGDDTEIRDFPLTEIRRCEPKGPEKDGGEARRPRAANQEGEPSEPGDMEEMVREMEEEDGLDAEAAKEAITELMDEGTENG